LTNYWLCLISPRNWEFTKKNGVYGVWEKWKNRLQQVKKGDVMIFYVVPRRKQIVGMARVSSEPFDDFETEIWPNELYPHRVQIKILRDITETPLSIYDVIKEMLLFKGKFLGPTLYGKSIIPLSEHDFKVLLKALKRRVVKN